jgi:F0F1-type ATP synthase assembly protein I
MADKDRSFPFVRSAQSLQENLRRSGPVIGAAYTLIGGTVLLGGLGYALDRWLATLPWFFLGGVALGMVVGFYELVRASRG